MFVAFLTRQWRIGTLQFDHKFEIIGDHFVGLVTIESHLPVCRADDQSSQCLPSSDWLCRGESGRYKTSNDRSWVRQFISLSLSPFLFPLRISSKLNESL